MGMVGGLTWATFVGYVLVLMTPEKTKDSESHQTEREFSIEDHSNLTCWFVSRRG